MIKYNLVCKRCDLTFDSWFASSKEYEKLVRKNLLNCHSCGSLKVEKSLMAPKLISKKSNDRTEKELQKYTDRPVEIRLKPNRSERISTKPLEAALADDVYCLITYNSIAALEALNRPLLLYRHFVP